MSLAADVARVYVLIRTIEERLRIARDNVEIQRESLRIAEARFRGGATSERDVQQALTQLRATEGTIPQLVAGLRQAGNALCTLLGLPPRNLDGLLGAAAAIPQAPLTVAIGIPADLLRRRPDIRLAELQAAAQCARIGVAKADLYPALSLNGTFGFLASDVGRFSLTDVASWNSRTGSFGPAFTWNLLNYGQITNRVRVQDARFQELIFNYQDTGAAGAAGGGGRAVRLPAVTETSHLPGGGGRGGQAFSGSRVDSVPRRRHGLHHRAHRANGPFGSAGQPGCRARRCAPGVDCDLPRFRGRLGNARGEEFPAGRRHHRHGQPHQLGRDFLTLGGRRAANGKTTLTPDCRRNFDMTRGVFRCAPWGWRY